MFSRFVVQKKHPEEYFPPDASHRYYFLLVRRQLPDEWIVGLSNNPFIYSFNSLMRTVDDVRQVENWQEHADHHAANHHAKEYDQQRFNQRHEAGKHGLNLFVEKVRHAFKHGVN